MPRILVAECKQEVSTFNPVLSGYEDFEVLRGAGDSCIAPRAQLGDGRRAGGVRRTAGCGGRARLQRTLDDVGRYAARGGLPAHRRGVCRGVGERAWRKRRWMRVYFSLHGAMAAEDELDPEGRLLEITRAAVGPDVPIVISMDLHGIPTDKMLRHCDALTAFHTYPHVDFADTGMRAARLLLRMLDGEVDPVMAFVTVPALVRGNELITETGLFGEMIREAQRYERETGALAAGMFIGNPFTDVPELQTYSYVIRDGDAETAATQATELANRFWAVRERLHQPLTSMDEAVEMVKNARRNGDPGGRGRRDKFRRVRATATRSCARLMDSGYEARVLAPIVDAAGGGRRHRPRAWATW